MHDTNRSRSLLQHLGVKERIRLLSTAYPCPERRVQYFNGLVRVRLAGASTCLTAKLGDSEVKEHLSVEDWWTQIVWILRPEMGIARRDIILAAADKDGGAHVDTKLTVQYEDLIAAGAAGFVKFADRPDLPLQRLEGAHLVSLRQIGYEVLASRDVQILLSRGLTGAVAHSILG